MNHPSNKLITIGITAYNEGSYLQEAWDSVLKQTDDLWEAVMLLDGGANKMTQKVFDGISHPSLRKIKLKVNKGPYPCRTQAIAMTKTDWYFHLDGDDILPNNAVELILHAINREPKAEFIFGSCEHFGKQYSKDISPATDTELLCYHPLFIATSPIKKSLIYKLGGYCTNLKVNADWDFWLSVFENNILGKQVNSVIYRRRVRQNSLGNKLIAVKPDIINIIIERHPIFFNSVERKHKALHYVYEKQARYYRSIGKRKLAKKYADLTIQNGNPTQIVKSINLEMQMSSWRYFIRRLYRLWQLLF